MPTISLRLRLLLWFWGLLLAGLAPLYLSMGGAIQSDLHKNARERALLLLDASCWLVETQPPFASEDRFDEWLTGLGGRLGVRLTYVAQGRVVADSEVVFPDLPSLEHHGSRPEILAARRGETGEDTRRSATVARDLIYVARACAAPGAAEDGVLRVALPVAELSDRVAALKQRLLLILFGGLVVSALLALLATRGLMVSIRELSDMVTAIGRGAYDRRVRVYSGREFAPLVEAVNAMAEDIERHVRVVEEQGAQLQALFNGLSEGVMTVDAKGRVVSVNPAFLQMFPEARDAQGKAVIEVTLQAELGRAVTNVLAREPGGRPARLLMSMNGRELEARIEAYADARGERRAVVVVQDQSRLRRLEQMRRDFVANVSHELRTPLTSIRGYAETLADLPPERETERGRFLSIIQKNADHMSRMVESLLALARWENSQPGASAVPVDARALIDEALAMLRPEAGKKGVRLLADVPADLPRPLADAAGLADVLRNVLDNAVKYSPRDGEVRISAHGAEDRVVFRVEDQGPGIPAHARDRVFERFYRVGDGPGKKDGGAGLGLAICRNILAALGGTIRAESPLADGKGTAFVFDLPRA